MTSKPQMSGTTNRDTFSSSSKKSLSFCHSMRSMRFRCACGTVYAWRGSIAINCSCGRFHTRANGKGAYTLNVPVSKNCEGVLNAAE